MKFKSIFLIWLIITLIFGLITYLLNTYFPSHTLWPFGAAFIYLGVLMLFTLYVVSQKKE